MKVITLCGSTKFENKYREINEKLTLEGNVVLSCGVFKFKDVGKEKKRDLLQAIHKEKIVLSDEIFVVNVGGYIGDHTAEEIEYAKQTNKKIRYLENAGRN